MAERFAEMLRVGGSSNSLGRAGEVVEAVLAEPSRLAELFDCLFLEDAWQRMRAADALEKVCRGEPALLVPYLPRLLDEVAAIDQASVQWHLAQLLGELPLTPSQTGRAIAVLTRNLRRDDVDWIVASHSMETLAGFARDGRMPREELLPLLRRQQGHRSRAVVRRATRLLDSLTPADR